MKNSNKKSELSFYVKYCEDFTEDLYNKLWEWSKQNSKGNPRNWSENYKTLKKIDTINPRMFIYYESFYGVDNNPQGAKVELSVSEVKELIGYNKSEEWIPKMEEIQAECKRRFPIGCTFESVISNYKQELKDDDVVYSIAGNDIYAHNGAGCLYSNGEYAELISMPEPTHFKFIIGKWYKYINHIYIFIICHTI